MSTRQIAYPNVRVEPAQGDDVSLMFVVPGSKFGNVVVILGPDQVTELVAALAPSPVVEEATT